MTRVSPFVAVVVLALLAASALAGGCDCGDTQCATITCPFLPASDAWPQMTTLIGTLVIDDAAVDATGAYSHNLTTMSGLLVNATANLTSLAFPLLTDVSGTIWIDSTTLATFSVPLLDLVDTLTITNVAAAALSFPALTSADSVSVSHASALVSLSMPLLDSSGVSLTLNALPLLTSLDFVSDLSELSLTATGLVSFSLNATNPNYITLDANPALVSFALPIADRIRYNLVVTNNAVLSVLSLPSVSQFPCASTPPIAIVNNSAFCDACSLCFMANNTGNEESTPDTQAPMHPWSNFSAICLAADPGCAVCLPSLSPSPSAEPANSSSTPNATSPSIAPCPCPCPSPSLPVSVSSGSPVPSSVSAAPSAVSVSSSPSPSFASGGGAGTAYITIKLTTKSGGEIDTAALLSKIEAALSGAGVNPSTTTLTSTEQNGNTYTFVLQLTGATNAAALDSAKAAADSLSKNNLGSVCSPSECKSSAKASKNAAGTLAVAALLVLAAVAAAL